MSGNEVFKRLKSKRNIDIIISSGYLKLDEEIVNDAALIIAKPFDLELLGKRIRKLLDTENKKSENSNLIN